MTLTELRLVRERMTRKKPRADLPVFFGAGRLVRNQRGDLRSRIFRQVNQVQLQKDWNLGGGGGINQSRNTAQGFSLAKKLRCDQLFCHMGKTMV